MDNLRTVAAWRQTRSRIQRSLGIGGVLAATAVAFLPLFENQFVNWDDPFALLHNERLGAPGFLAWAFTTTLMGHYQPASWLVWSQVQAIFGLSAAAFHAVSLLGHLANAGLVYLVSLRLVTLTGSPPRTQRTQRDHNSSASSASSAVDRERYAAIVAAALFAIHPIHVEVVAWASAFPYVLSLSWLLLALLAYLNYCTATIAPRRSVWFAVAVCTYVLSLFSRVTAIGFPLVLMALDVYPLRRKWRLLEKLPFFLVAILFTIVESRSRELAGFQEVGVGARLTMTMTAPFVYLGRILLPLPHSPVDPLPIDPGIHWPLLFLGLAALVAASIGVWKLGPRWPALPIAWFVFIVLLAPVVGLTPSGQEATADRYMYFPGVVVSLLAGAAIFSMAPFRLRRTLVVAISGVAVLLGVATWRQTHWWHDSITLWTRVADLDPKNDIATYNLAIALAEAGREDDAAARYEQTLGLVPDHAPARRNLTLLQAGRAEREGDSLAGLARLDDAIVSYSRALELDSERKQARTKRGLLLIQRGRSAEAAADLRAALDERPDDVVVANSLSFALMQTGRASEAAAVLTQSIARHPQDNELAHNLARLLATTDDPGVRDGPLALRLALAVRDRIGGREPRVLDTLAAAYAATGQIALARKTAEQGAALARQLGQPALAEEIAVHARQYK